MESARSSVMRGDCPLLPIAVVVIGLLLPAPAWAEGSPGEQQNGLPSADEQWQQLFDGKTLGKWRVIDEFDFARHGTVRVDDGRLVMGTGSPATGVKWSGRFPKTDYEVSLEAMRVDGDDFFSSITFPTASEPLTLVVGGWGGTIVGLSSIDGEPAVENETCQFKDFERSRWYRIRLRVTRPRIEVWIDGEKIVDLPTENRKFSLYWEMEPMLPFGIATWRTTGAVRTVRLRRIARADAEKPDD